MALNPLDLPVASARIITGFQGLPGPDLGLLGLATALDAVDGCCEGQTRALDRLACRLVT